LPLRPPSPSLSKAQEDEREKEREKEKDVADKAPAVKDPRALMVEKLAAARAEVRLSLIWAPIQTPI